MTDNVDSNENEILHITTVQHVSCDQTGKLFPRFLFMFTQFYQFIYQNIRPKNVENDMNLDIFQQLKKPGE